MIGPARRTRIASADDGPILPGSPLEVIMPSHPARPNILYILVDDMGWSDLGCFGAEIPTPHLDALAARGIRGTGFTNSARCCPTRACLLTGQHPHSAGIGNMTRDSDLPAYRGFLREDTATIAETLRAHGYATWLSGKWHVGGDYAVAIRSQWDQAGDATHPLPTQRGFDRYYGTLCGAGSYFNPPCLMEQDRLVAGVGPDYHLTDELGTRAAGFIAEAAAAGKPFFGYLAFTAPHWPLHARPADIAANRRYADGWDALRERRWARQAELGIREASWGLSPRDDGSRPWAAAPDHAWEAERMAVYAAQVMAMDRAVGRVLAELAARGLTEDTIIVFCSDNGGCAEFLREDGPAGKWPEMYSLPTNRGTHCKVGNRRTVMPGPAETFMSYDLPWANASNTPFRKFKAWTFEGGCATPLIACWPAGGVVGGRIVRGFGNVVDLAATAYDAAGATPLTRRNGLPIPAPAGRSLLPVWRGERAEVWGEDPFCWEHIGHAAARRGAWKIVRTKDEHPWELYDLATDRCEQHDLAAERPELVARLDTDWQTWADAVGVYPRG
jgi:arylsulfatase